MTMEALPIEVLTHILQYLSPIDRLRSEQVCKKWRDASRHTWRDVQSFYIIQPNHLDHYGRFRNCTKSHELIEKEGKRLFIGSDSPNIIHCLLSRVGSFINKLIFTYEHSENYEAILLDVFEYCNNLEVCEIAPPARYYEEELLPKLFECNKKLHSVRCNKSVRFIDSLPFRNWKCLRFSQSGGLLPNKKIISLIENSESLEEFETETFTAPIVEALQKCRNFKSLYFRGIYSKGSLKVIDDASLLKRLTNLSIYGLDLDIPLLCNMLQHCCQLKRLEIIDDFRKDPVKLLETISALPVLETLMLRSTSITDDMLIHLTKVKNLSLYDKTGRLITNDGILRLIKNSEVLEKLDTVETGITPEIFRSLLEEMDDRPKYLEMVVHQEFFSEKLCEIFAATKIRLVKEIQCFRNWSD